MSNLKPAAQTQHVGVMAAAREEVTHRRALNPFQSPSAASSSPADSLADAINRLVEQHAQDAARGRPEWMRDQAIRDLYFGSCSRAQYWKYTRLPDFPKAKQISPRIRVRSRAEIEAWLAARPEVA
jgi:predicted DNA-binding transcriptional regulator AlpA